MPEPDVTLEIVHDRLAAVEAEQRQQARDIAALRETSARTEMKVDTVLELAREDRAARAAERQISLEQRAKTETIEAETERERVVGRNKIALAVLGLLSAGGGIGALISSFAGCS